MYGDRIQYVQWLSMHGDRMLIVRSAYCVFPYGSNTDRKQKHFCGCVKPQTKGR